MLQEVISILSIMLGVVILTAWIMWLLMRKSGEDRAMQFARDAAKEQLTRGVMRINELENENRLLKKVLDDLNEKGLVGAEALALGQSSSQPAAAPTEMHSARPTASTPPAGAMPNRENQPSPENPSRSVTAPTTTGFNRKTTTTPPVGAMTHRENQSSPENPSRSVTAPTKSESPAASTDGSVP